MINLRLLSSQTVSMAGQIVVNVSWLLIMMVLLAKSQRAIDRPIANCFPKLRNWTNKDRTQSVSLQKMRGFAFAFRIKLLIISLQYFSNIWVIALLFFYIVVFAVDVFGCVSDSHKGGTWLRCDSGADDGDCV